MRRKARRRVSDHRSGTTRLFDIYHEEAGLGLVFYHPRGALLRTLIENYEKTEHLKRGYQMVITPHIMQADLWRTSGHYDYYRENMYTLKVEEKEFVLKPMNCPGHILIYKSKTRSYRDLPLRLFELGTVYRHEKSRSVTWPFCGCGVYARRCAYLCLPDQLSAEIKGIIDFVLIRCGCLAFVM